MAGNVPCWSLIATIVSTSLSLGILSQFGSGGKIDPRLQVEDLILLRRSGDPAGAKEHGTVAFFLGFPFFPLIDFYQFPIRDVHGGGHDSTPFRHQDVRSTTTCAGLSFEE